VAVKLLADLLGNLAKLDLRVRLTLVRFPQVGQPDLGKE